ncbi:hypothetical protein [Pseudomonas fluorescens]|uniref:Uncharacterized protein n=1 Tax=Pseudomonas fluorescens TaxID=294 RepID=A0A944HHI3_PSEFL|nr:hypothetical protein [Pseudomonas fluorescens]MBT2295562.1 hypothetical protein [Pseudomonas fluorescens]MBT2310338.1 hypothetical protein [Pseudomonas fluorescens]MBT2312489.1 hypothetical protein [Pseudomonas fluorescens]MBT2317944.1 hypothetical protein [Pseudomonas fluorescens]MBT2330834.1 hypothetical protein [Pseudomonas fluorescens]
MKEKDRMAAGFVRKNRQSLAFLRFSIGTPIATGFFCQTTDVIIRADFFSGQLP